MQKNEKRQPEHKLFVQRFVANTFHGDEHRQSTADGSDKEQGAFGDTPLMLLGRYLVGCCDKYGKNSDGYVVNHSRFYQWVHVFHLVTGSILTAKPLYVNC